MDATQFSGASIRRSIRLGSCLAEILPADPSGDGATTYGTERGEGNYMTLRKVECPRCYCVRRPILRHIDGDAIYVCPECLKPIEEAVTRAYDKPPRDKMVRAAAKTK
jgi:hypothetical protein